MMAAAVAGILLPLVLSAQGPKEITEPNILVLFPAGGSLGKTVNAEVRGLNLAGATKVWFDSKELIGSIQSVEELAEKFPEVLPGDLPPKSKPQAVIRAVIQVIIPPSIHPGAYALRLVTPLGLSNSVPFHVMAEPAAAEISTPHSTAKDAQEVRPPSHVFGRLEKRGEVDFYKIHAARGDTFVFELTGTQYYDPRLAIYGHVGSWFDPDRLARVLCEEEKKSDLMLARPRATFRAPEDGDYYLEVSALFGKGSPVSTYVLHISSGSSIAPEPAGPDWQERTFHRALQEEWIKSLAARGVTGGDAPAPFTSTAGAQAGAAPATDVAATSVAEVASTKPQIVQAEKTPKAITEVAGIPAILEGSIDHPGEIDLFRFKAEQGQGLAFEIETPGTPPPHFNPRIGVVDAADHEYFSNVDRRVSLFNNNADPHVFLKAISPRSTFTFERGGAYILQIRDITSRYGNPDFRYRILIRQQIPHVGEVSAGDADAINLRPGEPRKISLGAQFEEGFTGDVSFTMEGLPPGVQALPAAQYSDGRAPLEVAQNPEIVLPKEQKAAIVLVASPDAPITREPAIASLYCRPVARGKIGKNLLVRTFPVMIVAGQPGVKAETGK
jgi:hypothetical protein